MIRRYLRGLLFSVRCGVGLLVVAAAWLFWLSPALAGDTYDQPVFAYDGFPRSALDAPDIAGDLSLEAGPFSAGGAAFIYDSSGYRYATNGLRIPGLADDALQQVDDVLRRADGGLEPPPGVTPNGRQFMNDGRGGGQVLPALTTDGSSITYREWDVNPPGPSGRDAVRVVTGSDGSAWSTSDHYTTFIQIRAGS